VDTNGIYALRKRPTPQTGEWLEKLAASVVKDCPNELKRRNQETGTNVTPPLGRWLVLPRKGRFKRGKREITVWEEKLGL